MILDMFISIHVQSIPFVSFRKIQLARITCVCAVRLYLSCTVFYEKSQAKKFIKHNEWFVVRSYVYGISERNVPSMTTEGAITLILTKMKSLDLLQAQFLGTITEKSKTVLKLGYVFESQKIAFLT